MTPWKAIADLEARVAKLEQTYGDCSCLHRQIQRVVAKKKAPEVNLEPVAKPTPVRYCFFCGESLEGSEHLCVRPHL